MTDPYHNQPGAGGPQYGQQPGMPPQPGQPQYGQPQYGQPAPGQPQYGTPADPYAQPQPGYPAGAPGYPDPEAPYGRDQYGVPLSDKQKLTAGLLQLFVGTLGVGRFYTGHTTIGILQLVTCGGCGFWALIDGIMMLTGKVPDAEGRPLRD